MNPLKKSDGVNVLGLSSVYLRGKADAIEIRRLLELCDIHVVSMPGVGDSWESNYESSGSGIEYSGKE